MNPDRYTKYPYTGLNDKHRYFLLCEVSVFLFMISYLKLKPFFAVYAVSGGQFRQTIEKSEIR